MSAPTQIVRRRVLQAASLVILLFAAPLAAEVFAPSIAPFIPPFLLTSLIVTTGGYALLVWRTQCVVAALFPGQEVPVSMLWPKERFGDKVSALAGLIVSFAFIVFWLRTLP